MTSGTYIFAISHICGIIIQNMKTLLFTAVCLLALCLSTKTLNATPLVDVELVSTETSSGIMPDGLMVGTFEISLHVTPTGGDVYIPYFASNLENNHGISLVNLEGSKFTIKTNIHTGVFATVWPKNGGSFGAYRILEDSTGTILFVVDAMVPQTGAYRLIVDSIGVSSTPDLADLTQVSFAPISTDYLVLEGVPEPTTTALIGLGIVGATLRRRRHTYQ